VTGNAGLVKALEKRLNVKAITLRVASPVAAGHGRSPHRYGEIVTEILKATFWKGGTK